MHNIKVIGADGMLGTMLVHYLAKQDNVNLSATAFTPDVAEKLKAHFPDIKIDVFDAGNPDFDLFKGTDWVVNAIGIINTYIKDDNAAQRKNALLINSLFPDALGHAGEKLGFKVLQIATDCVYSGNKGSYSESDPFDPYDAYGMTKYMGEVPLPALHHLRCSIIGPEAANRKSLLEWFINNEKNANVTGFSNHLWNGVTTLHFAKICYGIITSGMKLPQLQHIVPGDVLPKSEMLKIFTKCYDRQDISITEGQAKLAIDRTLVTNNPTLNQKIWQAAGYDTPPTLEEMISEVSKDDYSVKFD
jgi:dTDP-4-dehydrorhamnose reductase